jgi:hypothetical protein
MIGQLTASIAESQILRREQLALRQGANMGDLLASRTTGFDACDVLQLRLLTHEMPVLLVFRCPKLAARGLHGIAPAKMARIKQKTGPFGGLFDEHGRLYVSDYDLMCVYRLDPVGRGKPAKLMASGIDPTKPRSPLSREASDLFRRINRRLVTKLQHGAQDDWASPENKGVNLTTSRFAAVQLGQFLPLGDGYQTKVFYDSNGLDWPYAGDGSYRGLAR